MVDDVVKAARQMIRVGLKAALATRDADTGAPFASMILVATALDGAPVTLISSLARHTRNLVADPTASVLIDTSNVAGDATSGGRISLTGQFSRSTDGDERTRFLARHPAAREYADFADFGFWRFDPAEAQLIEGFGRIAQVSGSALRVSGVDWAGFAASAPHCVADIQRAWPTVTGLDPEGVDLREGIGAHRLMFKTLAATVEAAREAAVACLNERRTAQ